MKEFVSPVINFDRHTYCASNLKGVHIWWLIVNFEFHCFAYLYAYYSNRLLANKKLFASTTFI